MKQWIKTSLFFSTIEELVKYAKDNDIKGLWHYSRTFTKGYELILYR